MLAASFGLGLSILVIDLSIFVFPPTSSVLNALSVVGSVIMSAGFLLVMWSRLHVVMVHHRRFLRALLVFIIVMAVCIHTPEIAAAVLRSTSHQEGPRLSKIVSYLQMYVPNMCSKGLPPNNRPSTFLVEDLFMVVLYIYYLRRYAKDVPAHTPAEARRAIDSTFRALLVFCAALVIDKIVLTALLISEMILLRTLVLTVIYPIVISLEFLFIKSTIKLSALKAEVLSRGNLWMYDEGEPGPPEDATSSQHSKEKATCCATRSNVVFPEANLSPNASESDETIFARPSPEMDDALGGLAAYKAQSQSTMHKGGLEDLERQYLGKTTSS
jgi:hypothetical protein